MSELTIAATTDALAEVMDFVENELAGRSCPPEAMTAILLSVEEAFVNIAHYAYPDMEGTATLGLDFYTDDKDGKTWAIFRLADSGHPYNPLDRADPDIDLPAEERQIGGLGIFLIKKSMDQVEYEYRDGQNILTLRKKI